MTKSISIALLAMLLTVAISTDVSAAANNRRHAHSPKVVKVLPSAHHRISHRGKSYYFSGGHFYRQNKGAYVTIAAPFGAVVPVLPGGYVSFGFGLNRYFYFQGVYYRHIDDGYEVIEEPAEASTLANEGSDKLIIYPADAQSEEQMDKDRYECHLWAIVESRFDPTDSESDPVLAADYRRAMAACLEARGYIVK